MFKERTTAPEKTNGFFYSNTNPYYKNGFGMPNCTAYAWGRFAEIHNKIVSLFYGNAEDWYNNTNAFKKGSTPKVGAVICWRKGSVWNSADGAGHVAIVERINPDGSILTSNSNYKGTLFYTKTFYGPSYYLGSGYVFQGFIYPDEEIGSGDLPTGKVGKPVLRDTSKNQIEINTIILRGRSSPTLPESDGNVSGIITPGYYNVLQTKDMTGEASNRYLWYMVEKDLWCADVKAPSVIYHPAHEPVNPLYDIAVYRLTEGQKNAIKHDAESWGLEYTVTEIG